MASGGTIPPVVVMALPLDVAPLRMMIYFLGAIGIVKEAFLGKFLVFWERYLECRDSTLNESITLWWRCSDTSDLTVDTHHKRD